MQERPRPKTGPGIIAAATAIVATAAGCASSGPPSPIAQSAPPSMAAASKTAVWKRAGNGIESTDVFTVGDSWSVAYTYDCSSFGDQANFDIDEDNPDGPNLVTKEVWVAGKTGSDVVYRHDSGQHSLEITTACSWTLTVTDGDDGR